MNKSKKSKIVAFLIFTFLCVFYICESSSIESHADNSFFGGDLICYDICIVDEESVSCAFPIISTSPIKEISMKELTDKDVAELLECNLSYNPSDAKSYNNYYINTFIIKFSQANKDISAFSSKINSFMLVIDDHEFEYKTPNFTICNDDYLSENGKYVINSGEVNSTNTDDLLSDIPTNDNPKSSSFSLYGDAFFINLKASEFYKFEECHLNNELIDPSNIYTRIDNQEQFNLDYSLDYVDSSYSKCITRSIFMLKYEQDCTLKMFVSNNELYVYPGYSSLQILKDFIDEKLL